MEQRCPPKAVRVVLVEPHVDRDEVSEGAHPLAVPSRAAVVCVQRGSQGEHPLGGASSVDLVAGLFELVGPAAELLHGAGAQRDRQP